MDAEQQQGRLYQRALWEEPAESLRLDAGGKGGTGTAAIEERQTSTAYDQA